MRSFHRNRSLETIFHFLKAFATLLLFYHSSFFPIFLQSFSHIYDLSITVFSNSFFAFLILNAIIISLYILSNQNGDVSNEDAYNQNLNQFLTITASELVTDPVESPPEKQEDQVVETALPEKQRDLSPVFKETVTAVTETTTTTMTCCTTVTTSGDDDKVSVSEKKCYQKVLSEFYERRCVVADQRREMKTCYVENMSKEEFNRTVEEFIAKHKRMQREEDEQLRSKKTEYLALVP